MSSDIIKQLFSVSVPKIKLYLEDTFCSFSAFPLISQTLQIQIEVPEENAYF
jgi:hypothetical protein